MTDTSTQQRSYKGKTHTHASEVRINACTHTCKVAYRCTGRKIRAHTYIDLLLMVGLVHLTSGGVGRALIRGGAVSRLR